MKKILRGIGIYDVDWVALIHWVLGWLGWVVAFTILVCWDRGCIFTPGVATTLVAVICILWIVMFTWSFSMPKPRGISEKPIVKLPEKVTLHKKQIEALAKSIIEQWPQREPVEKEGLDEKGKWQPPEEAPQIEEDF